MYRVCPGCRKQWSKDDDYNSRACGCTCHLILPYTKINSEHIYPFRIKEHAAEIAAWVEGLKEGDQVALLTNITEDGKGNQSFVSEIAEVKRIIRAGTTVIIDGIEVAPPVYQVDGCFFRADGHQINHGFWHSEGSAQIRPAGEWHREHAEENYLKQQITDVHWNGTKLEVLRRVAEAIGIKPFYGRSVPQEVKA